MNLEDTLVVVKGGIFITQIRFHPRHARKFAFAEAQPSKQLLPSERQEFRIVCRLSPTRKILRAEPLRSHFQAEIKFHVCGSPTAIVGKFPLALSSPLFVQGLLFQSQLFNVRFFVCLSKQSSAPALKALRTKMESSSVCWDNKKTGSTRKETERSKKANSPILKPNLGQTMFYPYTRFHNFLCISRSFFDDMKKCGGKTN